MYNRPSSQITVPAGVDVDGADSKELLLATLGLGHIVLTKNNKGHLSAAYGNKATRLLSEMQAQLFHSCGCRILTYPSTH